MHGEDSRNYSEVVHTMVLLNMFSFEPSITTWDSLARAFLRKYFPPIKIAKIVKDITTFQQLENESLCDA